MKIISDVESRELIKTVDPNIDPDNYGSLAKTEYKNIQIKLPSIESLNFLSKLLSSSSATSSWAIALLTDWSIFPNCEDLFLYYQLRKSSGNYDHIGDGPGHLFLNYEYHELRSLIAISLINSWDLLVVNNTDYTRYKTSHDGFVDIVSCDEEFIASVEAFKKAKDL